ncbi:cellulose biosynthesis protein BcsP [Paraburkholderia tropica]|uniref:cellulose biosynthesis protein BcsP n=1 Tax=Paraburkholderia tropica TaxID=92647 RepID=UPI002AB0B7C7|nr:cellulose biosynthesis protein BcsP [Paraburkholderia tropica]
MSTSRDVKALFDRFGGDASSYREIRMENEARDARGRWPLLGMIDPREVDLSAAEAKPGAPQAPELRVKLPRAQRDDTQATLRQSAPLFTRSPRRDVPPVIRKEKPAAPTSSAFRFSPTPALRGAQDEAKGDAKADPNSQTVSAADAQADAAPLAFAIPATGDVTPSGSAANTSDVSATNVSATNAAANAAANEASTEPARALPPLAPRFAQPASALGAAGAPAFASMQKPAPVQAAAPMLNPSPAIQADASGVSGTPRALAARGAIDAIDATTAVDATPLKKLFGRVGAGEGGARPHAPAPDAAPARLNHLFDRLRGGGNVGNIGKNSNTGNRDGSSEAAPRRPWFLKGVSGP